LHPYVCDVNAPDLVRAFNLKVPKQIRADILSMVALTEIWFGIDGVNAHELHHSADLLAVDQDFIIAPDDLGDGSIPPSGVSSVYFIDSAHDKQVLVGNDLLLGRIPINTAAVNAQQISLSADGQARIT
jgi:hypothetical protein